MESVLNSIYRKNNLSANLSAKRWDFQPEFSDESPLLFAFHSGCYWKHHSNTWYQIQGGYRHTSSLVLSCLIHIVLRYMAPHPPQAVFSDNKYVLVYFPRPDFALRQETFLFLCSSFCRLGRNEKRGLLISCSHRPKTGPKSARNLRRLLYRLKG